MIRALTVILACQLVGETLTRALGLPVPGPVLGMALLWAMMSTFSPISNLVRPVAEGILRHLSLLFVPAGVGVVGHMDRLGPQGLALGLAIVVSTALAICVGALAFTLTTRITERDDA